MKPVHLIFVGAAACAGGPASAPPDPSEAPPPSGAAPDASTPVEASAPATDAGAAETAPVTTGAGVLLFGNGAPIAGMRYASGARTGTTDATGAFAYDGPVTFSFGDLVFGTTAGAATLTPYALAGSASCEDTDALEKVVAALEALDGDGDASNGVTLPAPRASSAPQPVAAASWTDLDARVAGAGGRALAEPSAALRAFVAVFDAEEWKTLKTDTFALTEAALRGQGVATDGTSWFFSGTTGLERTDAAFTSLASNPLAIPLPLALAGSDHIGDIDYFGGKIYAPIEDKNYEAPKVVLYDPTSLASGAVFSIPQNLQTKGVPWIAVDGPRGVAYLAEWDPTPELHVFALADMTYQRAIPLTPATGRVQGAKVYKGQLYLSVDDDAKHVLKVHLASGTLLEVLALDLAGSEEEGLALLPTADGALLHTLDVPSGRTSVEMRHHAIVRPPLRWSVCP